MYSSEFVLIDEQKGTIDVDKEGERLTVNFSNKLEVNKNFE
jgi:hypothetical protein